MEELSSLDFESDLGSLVLALSLMVEVHPSPGKWEGALHLESPELVPLGRISILIGPLASSLLV